MPALHTETTSQNLEALIIADISKTSELVVNFYQQQGLEVRLVEIKKRFASQQHDQLQKILMNNPAFYKMVVVAGFSSQKQHDLTVVKQQVLPLLKNNATNKIFLIGVTSKIKSKSGLIQNWQQMVQREDELLGQIYQQPTNKKVILGLDVVDVQQQQISQPLKSLLQAHSSGYWLDPEIELAIQTVPDFFQTVVSELIKPTQKNFLVAGKKISTTHFLNVLQQQHQIFYQDKKQVIKINASTSRRIENKPNIIKAVVKSDLSQTYQYLCRDLPSFSLSVDRNLLKQEILYKEKNGRLRQKASPSFVQPALKSKNNNANKTAKTVSNKQNYTKQNRTTSVRKSASVRKLAAKPNQDHLDAQKIQQEAKKTVPQEDINQELGRLFNKKRTKQKTDRRVKTAGILSTIRRKSKHKQAVFWVGVFAAVIGVVFGLGLGGLAVGFQRSQQKLAKNIEALQTQSYQQLQATPLLDKQTDILGKIIDISLIEQSQNLVNLNQRLISISTNLSMSAQIGRQILSNFLENEKKLAVANTIQKKQELDQSLYQEISILEAEINNQEFSFLKPELQKQLNSYNTKLKQIKKQLAANQVFNPLLPKMLGVENDRTYYLIIQDNQELRPTGGFIQAIVMMKIKRGKLTDSQVLNVSQLEEKILGRLNSPPEIEALLGEEKLFLRDANWDPDYSYSAKKIAWFIRESLNQPIDGIFATNYNFLHKILEKNGSLDVVNYDEQISAQNLFDRLEYHANEEKEQELLSNLHVSIWESQLAAMKQYSQQQKEYFLQELYESLDSQQTLAYFTNQEWQQASEQLGWAGALMSPQCPTQFSESCTANYIYQVEANIGINKVNPYIKRHIAHDIQITNEEIVHHRTIKINNKSRSDIWPLGRYKTYLRFYVDSEAQLREVKVDGQILDENKVLGYLDHNRRVFGVVAEIAIQEEKEISLLYSVPDKIGSGESLFIFNQSQPGLNSTPTTISMSHHQGLQAAKVAPQADFGGNQIISSSDEGHSFLVAQFN